MKREPPLCTSMYSQGQVDSQVDGSEGGHMSIKKH